MTSVQGAGREAACGTTRHDTHGPHGRSSEHARLLARIRREFETTDEQIVLGPHRFLFTRVADPDAVLNEVCRQETLALRGVKPRRQIRMPYWAAVWESALGVAQYLLARNGPDPITNKLTLDLGCGMGLAGMAMAAMGARVTLVDIETASLLFAKLNTLQWPGRCDVRRCDWQTDDLGMKFDLIVGSDVLYEVPQWDYVETFLRKHVAADGKVIIGEPGRPKAEVFPDWIRARGWSFATSKLQGGTRAIDVFELAR
jgi:predicted nicotinamide N-methyase